MLGAYLTLDDEPSELDEQVLEMSPAMTKLFMHARDRLVTEALDTLVSGRGAEPIVVGVVCGAGHMPAVVHSLAACGFKPTNAEWLTVFGYD
jgi:pheromone shutdown protein TraB